MYIVYIQNNEDKAELKLDCVCADYTFADIKEMILPKTMTIILES